MKESKMLSKLGHIASELFTISLITYLILLSLEVLDHGFVSNFINLNLLLGIVFVSGIVMLLPIAERRLNQWDIIDLTFLNLRNRLKISKSFSENDFYLILLLALASGVLAYLKTAHLGLLSVIVSVLITLIFLFLTYLLFTDNENNSH